MNEQKPQQNGEMRRSALAPGDAAGGDLIAGLEIGSEEELVGDETPALQTDEELIGQTDSLLLINFSHIHY